MEMCITLSLLYYTERHHVFLNHQKVCTQNENCGVVERNRNEKGFFMLLCGRYSTYYFW